MQLSFHDGCNFGDLLNPYLFERLLPGFFDDDPRRVFVGIGSILGLKRFGPETERVIVFSSGHAAGDAATYGTAPRLDDRHDVVCVRGPRTAAILGLPPAAAVADGALLLRFLDPPAVTGSKSACYIPHVGSERMFDGWERLCERVGLRYVSPAWPVERVLQEIAASDVVYAEAMHGAIVADAMRVPWVPVRTYRHINTFKWQDFCDSMELSYQPVTLPSLFSREVLAGIARGKLGGAPAPVTRAVASAYHTWQGLAVETRAAHELEGLRHVPAQLSADRVWAARSLELRRRLEALAGRGVSAAEPQRSQR